MTVSSCVCVCVCVCVRVCVAMCVCVRVCPRLAPQARSAEANVALGPLWDSNMLPNGYIQTRYLPTYVSMDSAMKKARQDGGSCIKMDVLLRTKQGTMGAYTTQPSCLVAVGCCS